MIGNLSGTLTLFLLGALLLAISLFVVLPEALKAFLRWKRSDAPSELSLTILLAATVIMLISPIYLIGIRLAVDSYSSTGVLNLILYIASAFVTQGILLPRAIRHYQSWKTTDKSIHLSWMVLFSLLSLFLISFIYLTFISSVTATISNVP